MMLTEAIGKELGYTYHSLCQNQAEEKQKKTNPLSFLPPHYLLKVSSIGQTQPETRRQVILSDANYESQSAETWSRAEG
jgi:hypothetical protein